MDKFFEVFQALISMLLILGSSVFILSFIASVIGPMLRNREAKSWTEKNDLMDFSFAAILLGYLGLGFDENKKTKG